MGLLTAFKVVKSEHDRAFEIDDNQIDLIINELLDIKEKIKNLLEDIKGGHIQKAKHELFVIEKLDFKVLKALKNRKDIKGYVKAKKVLELIVEVLKRIDEPQLNQHLQELIEKAEETLLLLFLDEVREKKIEEKILQDFLKLYQSAYLSEDDIDNFIRQNSQYLRVKPMKKITKKMKRLLEKRLINELENYETFLENIANQLIRTISTKSSPEEQRELDYWTSKIQERFPDKDKEKVRRELSKLIHTLKKEVGRKGL